MAAAEYYYGTQGATQHNRPYPFPQPQFQFQQQQGAPPHQTVALPGHSQPPPPYSQFPQPPHPTQGYPAQPQQHSNLSNHGRPPASAPYPTTPPNGPQRWPSGPQPQQSGYLGIPLQPQRSHSQPPRVRFADDKYDSDDSALYSGSDSDTSRRQHRRHKHHRHHSHSGRDRSRSRGGDTDRDDDRQRRERMHRKEHKDRDTFLGAGGGAIIGDAIFPGLGTAAGLLLGGYGGRKHAMKRSKSEAAADRDGYHHSRHNGTSGWDAESGTFKKGWAVR